jgi:hypothetical protein
LLTIVVDPNKQIRLTIAYPASTGRNFPELLRVIDSLQLGDKYKITTPANWQPGQKVIVHPSVQGEKVKELFGDNVETVYVSRSGSVMLRETIELTAASPTSASRLTHRPRARSRLNKFKCRMDYV